MKRTLGVGFLFALMFAWAPPAVAMDLHLPNLVPLPPDHLRIGPADAPDDPEGPRYDEALRFSTTSYNRGDYTLDLLLLPADLLGVFSDDREVHQCIQFQADLCTERRHVGQAVYHQFHDHWHLEDYAEYQLLPVTADGLPDFDAEPVVPGQKVSFCMQDTDPPDSSNGGGLSTYRDCNTFRQGITRGHGDTYSSHLYGQQIPIDGLPRISYALVQTINPKHWLLETSVEDNRSWVVFDLGGDPCDKGLLDPTASGVS